MTSEAAPPAEETQRPLSEALAAATRSVHAKLNKLIITRLPLAIPPHSADPSIYVSGLLHIAPIYITFETLWKTIVESPQPASGETQDDKCEQASSLSDSDAPPQVSNVEPASEHQTTTDERIRSLLTLLYLPELMRSDRLRSDIASLTGWSPEVVNEQLKAVSESGRLAQFTRHVRRAVEKRPLVLLAYSYILFMALFAGGRFIRATLESAGSNFWEQVPSPIPPSQTSCQPRSPKADQPPPVVAAGPADLFQGDYGTIEVGAKHSRHRLPLSFFHFATAIDGEDLKKEYKKRLAESESTLTHRERHDIIQEAVCIFNNMLLLVTQLDEVCETDFDDTSTMAAWMSAGPGARLRDSLVVTRERRANKSSRGSGDSSGDQWLRRHARHHRSETDGSQGTVDLEGLPSACCPASRSMRFDEKLAMPHRKEASKTHSTDGAANLPSIGSTAFQQRQPSRSLLALLSDILLAAGLMTVVGMFFLSRRSEDVAIEAEA